MVPGRFYHLFNHANGRENLFIEEKNYRFFLEKLALHIIPACRVYAYCLMKNHFHLLISVRTKEELLQLWQPPDTDIVLDDKKFVLKTSKSFSNLFSSYTRAFNKVYERMGSWFIPSMKTELIDSDDSFRRVSCISLVIQFIMDLLTRSKIGNIAPIKLCLVISRQRLRENTC